ncbi:peptidylprolyl isomerase [Rhodoferax koreense]|uniref:Periplasmic chaperone PpiD n=1 Tax=Rhodoferax koreensis TaxID=1842727 RepID=A0A1P8JZ27_9BURK|nr:SurA N-terminal domain-containing protein [Rhodoferax koreense]APW39012.1 peptidylprolyl isomerase [Rhodoferax koreense]
MFDFVRKHTRIMMGLMFLLIIPSFVLFGIQGYNRMNEGGEVVAKVAGHDIKQAEWDMAHRNEVQRVLTSSPSVDPKMLDSAEARYATLEKMVRDRVLAAAADKSHLVTSDARLARSLESDPSIAALRKPDGTLDVERYRQMVGSQGLTPEMFEARVRSDLSARQVLAGVIGTSFVPTAEADVALNAFLEKREVQVAMFKSGDFASKVTLTDAELEAWYKEHTAQFQSPEQATIEYIVLDQDSVKKSIVPNEQDLKTYYEQNASKLAGQEERRASHILIASPKTASADERKKARAKAEELLAEVRKAPASFADVAKKNSQDPGSAANGGDLDFFTRGAMVKPFEDAAFGMKVGDISDVVESDFGYHIIKLTSIRAPKQRSFEEMRPDLEAELRNQQAARKFAEVADTFTNGVYEQADSLKPVADRLKLTVQTATVQRQPAAGAKGVLASGKFLDALFSNDAIEKKRNTEAVETGPSQLVSGRVVQHTPAHTLPFAEVKDRVRQQLLATRSAALAKTEGEARLAAWKANPASATTLPAAVVLSRETTQQQPATVVDAALRADPAALPAWAGIDLGDQGYAVVKVNKIMPREAGKEELMKQGRDQVAQAWATAENAAYYNLLKERFKVKINVPQPSFKTSADAAAVVKQ